MSANDSPRNTDALHRLSLIMNQMEDFSIVLGHIAHDLSTPVAAIRLFLDIERSRSDHNITPRSKETLAQLSEEARKAKVLIERLVEFKDSLALMASPVIAPCPLRELLEATVFFFNDEQLFPEHRFAFRGAIGIDVAPDWDASMMRQSLHILCRDLVRMIPRGSEILVELSEDSQPYQVGIFAKGIAIPERLLGRRPQNLRQALIQENDKLWHPTAQAWTEVNAMARLFDASWHLNWDAEGNVCWILKPLFTVPRNQ